MPAPGALSGLILAIPVALLAILAWSRRWTSEDAFIYYRVVENVLDGHGPRFNVGERVEAYTGPLWLGILALGRALLPGGVHLEWIAVGFGLVLSLAGLLAAALAATRLWAPPAGAGAGDARGGLALPLGALVVAVLPPFWDYATSGLETGLAFAWLGGSFLGLVALRPAVGREPEGGRRWARWALAVAIGLGPLVRPDLAIFAAAFLVLLVVSERPRLPGRALQLLALAAAVPVAYQLWRMGYFAAVVPNTALAKEAGSAFWGRGLEYLVNLLDPYWLWLPLAVLLAFGAGSARLAWRRGERDRTLLVAVPLAAGLLHALYVVRLGGDYMHARMLLPSVFCLLLPVMVVAPAQRRSTALLALMVVPWAIVCATSLRAPAKPPEDRSRLQVNDQRRRYAEVWGYRHPVTLDGLLAAPERRPALQRRQGLLLAGLAERGRAVVLSFTTDRNRFGERSRRPEPLARARPRPRLPSDVVAWLGSIGRVGYAAGPGVHLVDANGLADPLGARVRLPRRRSFHPGHEKFLPRGWVLARYAVPATPADARWLADRPGVRAARAALACEPLRELVAATTQPLTPSRFFANVAFAVREQSLRFSPDPRRAARELCRRE